MKYHFLSLLICLPFVLFSQDTDSVAIAQEVDSLIQVTRNLIREQKFEEALQTIEVAKNTAESEFGTNSMPYANCLLNQGRTYYYRGWYEDAEAPYKESMLIMEKIQGRKNKDFASALNARGALYKEMGQYSKAELLYLEARDIREIVLGKESVYYAYSLANLANLYEVTERYDEAEALYLELKDIWAIVEGKQHSNYAFNLHGLAYLYLEMGHYAKAKPLFLEAQSILAKSLGELSPDYALVINNLANLYAEMGSYETAEPILLEAKDILEKNSLKEHPDYAVTLFKLANLYLDIGAYSTAEPLFLESIDLWEKLVGKEHLNYATVVNNLAILYMHTGDYDKAERLYLEARDIWADALGTESRHYALALNNLANLYKRKGELIRAMPLYKEALEIWENVFGKENPQYATFLNNLGSLYLELEDFAKAEPLLSEAIEIQIKILGREHPHYARSLSNFSTLYWETGRILKAKEVFLELNELHRSFIKKAFEYTSENQLLAYLKTLERDQARFISFAQFNSEPELNQSCYDNMLFYRGQLLENARRLTRSVSNADSLTREIYAQWQDYRRRLSNEYSLPINDRRNVSELENEAENFEKILTNKLPTFAGAYTTPNWQKVLERLQPGEAAVEFIQYRLYDPQPTDIFQYAALILLSDKPEPLFVPLCQQTQLNELLAKKDQSEDFFIKNLYFDPRKGNETPLYQLIWKPIEPLLQDVQKIWYTPAGDLHRINLSAVQPVRSGKTLGDRYDLVAVGSTRQLVSRIPFVPVNNETVIFGDIDYDMDTVEYRKAISSYTAGIPTNDVNNNNFQNIAKPSRVSGNRGADSEWQELKFSAVEVNLIQEFLQNAGFQSQLFRGYNANEEACKNIGHAGISPRILNFSTHGFFFPDPELEKRTVSNETFGSVFKMSEHPLLRSGLILAGANYAWKNQHPFNEFEDGILTAYEISQLNLSNTELVVLSACETGLGDIIGNEGIYGLQRAFKIAGVKYILMSLWSVPDEATSKLMEVFYRNYLTEKMPVHQAFDEAQKWLRGLEGFDNPYYWAGFVLLE